MLRDAISVRACEMAGTAARKIVGRARERLAQQLERLVHSWGGVFSHEMNKIKTRACNMESCCLD